MKKVFFYLLLVILLTGCTKLNGSNAKIPIFVEFDEKVVYTTDQSVDKEALQKDCQKRGGKFRECGSSCKTGDVCAAVCAFTCEFD